jgi:soluble lytic murein transglycosylase
LLTLLATTLASRASLERAGPQFSPSGLESLAAQADRKTAWPALRKYAESAKDREMRGRAYFVLGYREYEASDYGPAAGDLDRAAGTNFLLADFAVYYEARAALSAKETDKSIEALQGFASRFPESTLRAAATGILAQALLQTNQPERAIQALTAETQDVHRATLALLLARAYLQAQRLPDAARAFQDVYYNFPTGPEAQAAGENLAQLKAQLGSSFPRPEPETLTHRAELLFNRGRFDDARHEYLQLVRNYPGASEVGEWQVAEARCLIRLKRAGEAVDVLKALSPAESSLAAEVSQALVDANAQLGEADAMLQALDHLSKIQPPSKSYASALNTVGGFYVRRGDWNTAGGYYSTLVVTFPEAEETLEATWRLAWSYYLDKQSDKARQAFIDHITRYPDSPHLPASLYWLGRLAEDSGQTAEAKVYFSLLQTRFVHSYYTGRAAERMERLPSVPTSGGTSLAATIPLPRPVPAELCGSESRSSALPPFVALKQLNLTELAKSYLHDVLAEHPSEPRALLALGHLEAEAKDYAAALFATKRVVPEYPEYDFVQLPKETWDLLFPKVFWNLVSQQARANRLDSNLVLGVIRQESAFDPHATSSANARGLMQVLPSTAGGRNKRSRLTAEHQLYNPDYNIRVGCHYLAELIRAFNGNVEEAVAAYNAGDTRVKEWLQGRSFSEPAEFVESIPFRDTRAYVEAVMRDGKIYKGLFANSTKFKKCSSAVAAHGSLQRNQTADGCQLPGVNWVSGARG